MKNVQKMNDAQLEELKLAWRLLLAQLGAEEEQADRLFGDLAAHYSAEGRYYHDLNHIQSLLTVTAALAPYAEDYRAIQLAIWFHDVIYDPWAADNEKQSADYAARVLAALGQPEALIESVRALILATENFRTGENSGNIDHCILMDADLATLAAPPEMYNAYARAIRLEYCAVPEGIYRQRRRQIIEMFLARDRIYLTEPMHASYEARARENLRRELNELAAQIEESEESRDCHGNNAVK